MINDYTLILLCKLQSQEDIEWEREKREEDSA